jgi:uncharacterized protein YdaU (DUF1376 family)
MNFYKRHIGDYIKDTAHLSLLEHGVYTRLLDVYYTRESGIPDDQAARLIGARGRDEASALKVVLKEFFELVDGTWVQDRCEREIQAAGPKPDHDGEDGAKSSKATRQHRYRERRKAMFDALRERGVTMSWDASMEQLQDELLRVSVTSPVTPETHNVTATISQTPDTRLQTPDFKPLGPASAVLTEVGPGQSEGARFSPGEISKAMRSAGVPSQPADPRIIAIAAQGVSLETVESACAEARKAKPNESIGVGYVVAIIERWAREAAAIQAQGAKAPAPDKPRTGGDDWSWKRSDQGIERKGRELGLFARGGESYRDFADRIEAEILKRKGQPA